MSPVTPSRIHAPKPQKPYPASPLSRPTSPTSTLPRGSGIEHRGRESSRPKQALSRPVERKRSPIPPLLRHPSSRSHTAASNSPPSYSPPSTSLQQTPIDHKSLRPGDVVRVVESAQYPIFQFIDSAASGATRHEQFNIQRQKYLAWSSRGCRSEPRPAMIVEADAQGKHTVLVMSRWSGDSWNSLSLLKRYLSVEVMREGIEPEFRHQSELAVNIPGWCSEGVSYMILHQHKLNPSTSSIRGHVVEVTPFKVADSPRAVEELLQLERMAKRHWLNEKTQAERDAAIAQFFRDASCVDQRGIDAPSPSKSYRAPQVHTPGGNIIRPQMRSALNSPVISRSSTPAPHMRGLL